MSVDLQQPCKAKAVVAKSIGELRFWLEATHDSTHGLDWKQGPDGTYTIIWFEDPE